MAGCRPLTDEEIELVMKSFTGRHAVRNRCLFEFMVRTGFRIAEVLSVKVADVEQHGHVVSQITIEPRNMKGKRRGRTLVLHAAAKTAIAALLDEYEQRWGRRMSPDMYLFRSQLGVNRPLSRSHVASFLHEIYDRHQFTGKLGTHALRKVFARRMWDALGKDLIKTQAAMGHTNVNSTVAYLKNFSNDEINAAILGT